MIKTAYLTVEDIDYLRFLLADRKSFLLTDKSQPTDYVELNDLKCIEYALELAKKGVV
jgi:hypothetical protein